MADNPTNQSIDECILALTARSLDGKPAGSVAMISEATGFKKMPFWWVVRVHGLRIALQQVYRDWCVRRGAGEKGAGQ